MANTPSAKKRVRQNDKRRAMNASRRSEMRTYIKTFLKAIQAGDKDAAKSAFSVAVSKIDRVAKTILHKNTASRYKSRLHAKLKALDQA